MVLVIVSMTVGFTASVGYLFATHSITERVLRVSDEIDSRLVAESGIDIAQMLIESTPDWDDHMDGSLFVNTSFDTNQHLSVSGVVLSVDSEPGNEVTISSSSFELASDQLNNSFINPQLSGAFGDWQATRDAVVLTGATVPRMGVSEYLYASDGTHVGFVNFIAAVNGSGTFTQTLDDEFLPNTTYRFQVDVGIAGIATLLPEIELTLSAGGTTVGSMDDCDLLTILDLGSGSQEISFEFTTGDSPPTGNIEIELKASSLLGLLCGVGFDNVRLEHLPPAMSIVQITAVGTSANEEHVLTVDVGVRNNGSEITTKILNWRDAH